MTLGAADIRKPATRENSRVLCDTSVASFAKAMAAIIQDLKELRQSMTIVLVTNLTQQARRLADRTMFLWNGEIVEIGDNDVVFGDRPVDRRTRDYIEGIFG